MAPRLGFAVLALCVLYCMPHTGENPPAARVPTHVLTLEQSGTLTEAEQGDLIEIRLDAAAWRLTRQSGEGRVEPYGEQGNFFRYRATGVGQLELTFAGPERTAAFRFAIR